MITGIKNQQLNVFPECITVAYGNVTLDHYTPNLEAGIVCYII